MKAAIRASKSLRDVVLKYIEYIVEFDNSHENMNDLLYNIYMLLEECGVKSLAVLSRVNNAHIASLTSSRIRDIKVVHSDGLSINATYSCRTLEDSNNLSDESACSVQKNLFAIRIDETMRSNIRNLIGYEYV